MFWVFLDVQNFGLFFVFRYVLWKFRVWPCWASVAGGAFVKVESRFGCTEVQMAIALACICSIIFHACFMSEDVAWLVSGWWLGELVSSEECQEPQLPIGVTYKSPGSNSANPP